MPDDGVVRPAVLVLNRSTLVQTYSLEPWHYGEADEQEEVIRRRTVSFRKHLLGVVLEADLTKVLEVLKGRDQLVRDGRARVRDLIVREREQVYRPNTVAGSPEDTRPARLHAA